MYVENTKRLISCQVTPQLICAFVFAYANFLMTWLSWRLGNLVKMKCNAYNVDVLHVHWILSWHKTKALISLSRYAANFLYFCPVAYLTMCCSHARGSYFTL